MSNITWSWPTALRMLATASLPTALILAGHVQAGLVAYVGILPAAMIPLAPARRDRAKVILVGLLFGLSAVIGSLLSQSLVIAVIGVGALAFASVYLMTTRYIKMSGLIVGLCLPVIGIGFSFPDIKDALGMAVLMTAGGVWGYLVSLLPFKPAQSKAEEKRPNPARRETIIFGVCYALAASLAVAIPLALGWDHAGWVAGATLFVMRPRWNLQKLRMTGRVLSVLCGALLSSLVLWTNPSEGIAVILMTTAIVFAGATQGSRWYVTPLFSTFMVFFVLLFVDASADAITYRFTERVGETLAGVSIACIFGYLAMSLARLIRR